MCKTVGKYYENGKYFLEYHVDNIECFLQKIKTRWINISRINAIK